MIEIIYLMAIYGITFALQHKIPKLFRKKTYQEFTFKSFRETLLVCSYCIGFHAGWITYLLSNGINYPSVNIMLIFAFAGAAFSYTLDTYVQKLEQDEEGSDEDSEEE